MYTKGKKIDIKKLILGIAILFIVILLIVFAANSANKNKQNKTTTTVAVNTIEEKLDLMIDAAKKYFINNLPDGKGVKIELEDLYELNLIDELKDCDEDSYSYITPNNDGTYEINSKIECSNKQKSKTETVKVENNKFVEAEESSCKCCKSSVKKNSSTTANTTSSECNCSCTQECEITQIPTTCKTTYYYEFVKSGSCPSGYTYNNGKCEKTTVDYAALQITVYDPNISSKNTTDTKDQIASTEYYCASGSRSGNECVSTTSTSATGSESCPDWGNPYSTYDTTTPPAASETKTSKVTVTKKAHSSQYTVRKYSRTCTTSYSCPSGYSLSGSTCVKSSSTPLSTRTVYTCPSGYNKENGKCVKTITKNEPYCNDGDNLKNGVCYNTSCPSGYSEENSTCVKKTTSYKDYEASSTKWSTSTSLEGYTRTGNITYKTVCEEISK